MIHETLAERVGQRSGRRAGGLVSPPTSAVRFIYRSSRPELKL